jgi:hypothetical protein
MWREQLTIPSSGIAGNPIVFSSYGAGAQPIINGANVVTSWNSAGNNLWWTNNPNPTTTRAMVISNGTILSEVNSLAAVTAGKYFIDVAATPDRVYVNSVSAPSNMEVSARNYCIQMPSWKLIHHVNIVGIECRYSGGGGIALEGNGIDFNGFCVVDSCTLYANRLWGCRSSEHHNSDTFKNSTATYNGNGFYVWDGTKNITMQRCSTMHTISYLIKPNFTDGHGFGNYRGDNWLVEYCFSDDDFDGIHIDCGGVAANAIIRYNKVYNSRNSVPKSPGYAVGTVGAGATIQIYYNLSVNCASSSLEAFTTMSGRVLVYNNTFYHDATSGENAVVYIAAPGSGWTFKNNLFIRNGSSKNLIVVTKPPLATCDHNLYYILNNPSGTLRNSYNGTTYTSLASWQAATGQDANSFSVNPNLNSDYSLKGGSPCIDKGVNVGLTKDILGNPIVGVPDIGAFEYGSGVLLPLPGLTSFTGVRQDNRTILTWELALNCSFSQVTVERSTDGINFIPVADVSAECSGEATKQSYVDYFAAEGNQYYRLRLSQPGSIYKYSNVLILKGKSPALKGFKVYPNLISTDATINLDANKTQQGILMISDYSGRIVKQQTLNLQEGNNTFEVTNLDRLASGNYIAVIRTVEGVYSQKITIR